MKFSRLGDFSFFMSFLTCQIIFVHWIVFSGCHCNDSVTLQLKHCTQTWKLINHQPWNQPGNVKRPSWLQLIYLKSIQRYCLNLETVYGSKNTYISMVSYCNKSSPLIYNYFYLKIPIHLFPGKILEHIFGKLRRGNPQLSKYNHYTIGGALLTWKAISIFLLKLHF